MKQILCMKWGQLYGPEYVNRLYAMARAHTTGLLRFVCLTDDPGGIRAEVECLDCPDIPIPAPYNRRGWRKLTTYAASSQLHGLTGQWLFLDLDVVIMGALDDFFTYCPDKHFVVMRNWTQPGRNIGNTSVYRFTVGADEYLLSRLIAEQDAILATFRNSQTYISRTVRELVFWPDDWCVLFKTHCVPPWPLRFWKTPSCPDRARVVAFPGVPNPHEAVKGRWPAPAWKKSYKYIRPTPWIREAWDLGEASLAERPIE